MFDIVLGWGKSPSYRRSQGFGRSVVPALGAEGPMSWGPDIADD
jgi:hypothetical protein